MGRRHRLRGSGPADGFVYDTVEEGLAFGMGSSASRRPRCAAASRRPSTCSASPAPEPGPAPPSGSPAAAGRDRFGADHALRHARAGRGPPPRRPVRRRGRARHLQYLGARRRTLECCSPSTTSSGCCRSPCGSRCSPETADCWSRMRPPCSRAPHHYPPIVELGRAMGWEPMYLSVTTPGVRYGEVTLPPAPEPVTLPVGRALTPSRC